MIAAAVGLATYEPVVKELYFKGNDIRNDPSILKSKVNSNAQDFLDKQGSNLNLHWSDCLSRACRALVDENGPYGVPGKTAYSSGDTGDRVDKFCAKASGVKEA